MHELNAHLANTLTGMSISAWILTWLASAELWLQLIAIICTIGAAVWSMLANRAKARAYDRMHRDDMS